MRNLIFILMLMSILAVFNNKAHADEPFSFGAPVPNRIEFEGKVVDKPENWSKAVEFCKHRPYWVGFEAVKQGPADPNPNIAADNDSSTNNRGWMSQP